MKLWNRAAFLTLPVLMKRERVCSERRLCRMEIEHQYKFLLDFKRFKQGETLLYLGEGLRRAENKQLNIERRNTKTERMGRR